MTTNRQAAIWAERAFRRGVGVQYEFPFVSSVQARGAVNVNGQTKLASACAGQSERNSHDIPCDGSGGSLPNLP